MLHVDSDLNAFVCSEHENLWSTRTRTGGCWCPALTFSSTPLRQSLSLSPPPLPLSLNPEPTISARFVGLQTAYIFLSLPPTVIGLHRQPHALHVGAGDLDADPGEIDSDTHAWPKVLLTRQLFLLPLEYILFIFNCNFRLIFSS